MQTLVRTLLLFGLVLCAAAPAYAQGAGPLEPLDTSSPSATLQSFKSQFNKVDRAFQAYQANKSRTNMLNLIGSAEHARRLFDVSAYPPATQESVAERAAAYLVDILLRLPEPDPAGIPGAPGSDGASLPARWTFPQTEVHIDRIAQGPRAGEYLFSADTVARLPEFHARIIDLPPLRPSEIGNWGQVAILVTGPLIPDWFTNALPPLLNQPVLGTAFWKLIAAILLTLLMLMLVLLWGMSVRRLTREAGRVKTLLWRMTVPALIAIFAYLFRWVGFFQLSFTGDFADGATIAATVGLYLAGAWLASQACFLLVEAIITSPKVPDQSYDANLLRLAARVGSLLAAGAVLVYGANDIGVPALGLVAGLGVGGVALALAAQSTVENLFGGVSIFADRPFRVGDFIQYGNSNGTVEAIGPRSTRIRGLDGTLTSVPNGDMAKTHITNFSMRTRCLFRHKLGLRYETSAAQFTWLLAALRTRIGAHPMVERGGDWPRVRLIGFGASSVDIDVWAYVLTTSWSEFLAVQEQLMLEVMKTVEEAGTGFAFPSQTAYFTRDRGLDATIKARIQQEAQQRILGSASASPPGG